MPCFELVSDRGFAPASPALRARVGPRLGARPRPPGRYSTSPPRPYVRSRGVSLFMANIASQEKRNQRSLRERLENRRYTSSVKTYFRRLEAAVASGDSDVADAEYRTLVS